MKFDKAVIGDCKELVSAYRGKSQDCHSGNGAKRHYPESIMASSSYKEVKFTGIKGIKGIFAENIVGGMKFVDWCF